VQMPIVIIVGNYETLANIEKTHIDKGTKQNYIVEMGPDPT